MPTLRIKKFAIRDAMTLERLVPQNFITENEAQRRADKLNRRGRAAAVVVPVEED